MSGLFRTQPSGRIKTSNLIPFGSTSTYPFTGDPTSTRETVVPASKRSVQFVGAASKKYDVNLKAYRVVDPDVSAGGVIQSSIISPAEGIYDPLSNGMTAPLDISQGQITRSNASTYIADAAIGSAQIGDASITNAKIGRAAIDTANIKDLSVDTFKIAGDSVITPVASIFSGSLLLNAATWYNIGSVTIDMRVSQKGAKVILLISGGVRESNTALMESGGFRLLKDGVVIAGSVSFVSNWGNWFDNVASATVRLPMNGTAVIDGVEKCSDVVADPCNTLSTYTLQVFFPGDPGFPISVTKIGALIALGSKANA